MTETDCHGHLLRAVISGALLYGATYFFTTEYFNDQYYIEGQRAQIERVAPEKRKELQENLEAYLSTDFQDTRSAGRLLGTMIWIGILGGVCGQAIGALGSDLKTYIKETWEKV